MEENIDLSDNWANYLNDVHTKINSMWSFFIYNEFYEKEYIELNKKYNELKLAHTDLKEHFEILKKRNSQLRDNLYTQKEQDITRKRKAEDNLLKNEFKKIKRYSPVDPDTINKIIIDIFNNLNNINDIIKLKNHPNKFDFINNNKFNKLYNIIPALEELNKIIGMNNVKEKIFKSICYFLYNLSNNNEMNHVMIMGPPGVGKTTVAKIIGLIYLKLGFLENDTFIVAKRSDLIAKYLGQTADKTQKVIDSALGGVLFIDEVYSLGNSKKEDSYAKECIDTINLNMSRTDKPWLLIVGGYKEEIESDFLAYNQGLERRFTIKLEINGYNETELYEILMSFIKEEQWIIENNAITIDDIKKHLSKFKYFGGDMRKLFQLAKENYCVRMMKQSLTLDNIEKKLIRDDFMKSIEIFNIKKEDNLSHLMMYI